SCMPLFSIGVSFHYKLGLFEENSPTYEAFKDSTVSYYELSIKQAIQEQDKNCLRRVFDNYFILRGTVEEGDQIIQDIMKGLELISDKEKQTLLISDKDFQNFRFDQLQLSHDREQTQYFIGGGTLFALLLILGLIFYQRIRITHLQQQLRSKLERLRAQVDPHFISNCLNAIELLINENKPQKAADYLIEFSRLCRGVLYSTTNSDVILAQEIDYLKNYVSLEQLRIGDKLQYEFVVHPSVNPQVIIVPTLLIQPFIENAIWHGIQKKEEGGKVKVSFSQIHNDKGSPMLYCRVQDNGIGREAAMIMEEDSVVEKGDSYGLSISNERIQILDRIKQARQKVTDLFDDALQPAGTLVEIWLPITHP
ncbi:MAG: histidine kinase, partial [Bacteroidota bacterium]